MGEQRKRSSQVVMDALLGPKILIKPKENTKEPKMKNSKMFVTITLRWTRESVSWSIPRDLSSRIPGCAGSNPASRIFFAFVAQ